MIVQFFIYPLEVVSQVLDDDMQLRAFPFNPAVPGVPRKHVEVRGLGDEELDQDQPSEDDEALQVHADDHQPERRAGGLATAQDREATDAILSAQEFELGDRKIQ